MKMSLLRSVVSAFERFAPSASPKPPGTMSASWSKVRTPYPREAAKRVFLTIDLTPEVLDEALQHDDVGVIVAYHPTIFRGWKRLNLPTDSTRDAEVIKQAMILKLAAKGVSLYCPHTSLDAASGGINDWLASGLVVTLREPKTVGEVVGAIKGHLGLAHVRLAQAASNHLVRTIAICAGHHEVLAAVQTKTHVVLCEHTNTERGYLAAVLQRKLQEELTVAGADGVHVVVSRVDRDPLVVV
ncbi:GTP cyclohydrolase 1 type 2/Nif3 [Catenaria anguillulae PL171]|uniref:GTP cyclohydrolase 1 type 2/Nif3 n=1 Tax=Catenaria anguillulae PL171 TaxID=765915 RepID=A0A1Y2HFM9_9FUNG|nr:GTP cyclohydrolase 1 type 2/Nif3 [Catenaria anguillulae PL171]